MSGPWILFFEIVLRIVLRGNFRVQGLVVGLIVSLQVEWFTHVAVNLRHPNERIRRATNFTIVRPLVLFSPREGA